MGFFDDDEDEESAGEFADGEMDTADEPSVFTTGWSALADGLSDAGAVMKGAGEELAAVAEPYVTEFATNAERDFEADPVGFLGTLGGAPTVKLDTDSSDGTLSVHAKGWWGRVDGDWQDGRGSEVHSELGMDWGVAPYVKTDLSTDDQGEITKASGVAKVSVPVEGLTAKSEIGGSYEKTAEGYKADVNQSSGISVDGIELTAGVKGGIDDHGERGMIVHGGPQASVGTGGLSGAGGSPDVRRCTGW